MCGGHATRMPLDGYFTIVMPGALRELHSGDGSSLAELLQRRPDWAVDGHPPLCVTLDEPDLTVTLLGAREHERFLL
jgi:hypothetical protein